MTDIEKIKEYLFNTENHTDKESDFYISEKYLLQTLEFLNGIEKEEVFPINKTVFFKLIDGKYLTENNLEITTEFLLKHKHAIYNDGGYLIIEK